MAERTITSSEEPQVFKNALNYGVDKPMINFVEGQLNLGAKNVLSVSDADLHALAEEGLIERREIGGGRIYFYVEAVADEMRFGVFIRLRNKRIEWLRLHWLDSPVKGWDDVSKKATVDEFRLLSNFIERRSAAHLIMKQKESIPGA